MIDGLDLFSGIGGISLALKEWVRPVTYCENDRYAQGVLLSRMAEGDLPIAPIWDDIRTLKGKYLRIRPDIIYGGFPCQDISVAGNGAGLEGERSGLFFEVMRLAKEIKPSFIFLENVPNIRTKGLRTVGEELANSGYDCRWCIVSAEQVGAPHLRKRWFLLAHARCESKRAMQKVQPKRQKPELSNAANLRSMLPDTNSERLEGQRKERSRASKEQQDVSDSCWWAVEPSVGRVVNGLPHRMDRIKCLGNAVVPKQVEKAFKELMGL